MQDLRVHIIQFAPVWEDLDASQKRLSEIFKGIRDVDIVVLPEMFLSGFTMNPSEVAINTSSSQYQFLLEYSKDLGIVICGSVIWEEGDKFYNRFLWIEDGVEKFHYDKRHLFSLAGEEKIYSKGDKPILIEYKGWKIAPFICYDIRFPVYMRRRRDYDYDLLIVVASWPERRHFAWQQLLAARAIENQSYVVATNRVGKDGHGVLHEGGSGMWDYFGKKRASIQSFKEDGISIILKKEDIEKFRNQFRFLEDADDFSINY